MPCASFTLTPSTYFFVFLHKQQTIFVEEILFSNSVVYFCLFRFLQFAPTFCGHSILYS